MNIYEILSSKPHDSHYLTKYMRFIERCQIKNTSLTQDVFERHHICPKAKDMFPQFSCLKENDWNGILLTPRQHFISHVMIWKAFPFSFSQRSALWAMKHKNGMLLDSKMYERLKHEMVKGIGASNSGTVWINDGSVSKIVRREVLSEHLNAGWQRGRIFTQTHRQKISSNVSQRYTDPSKNPNYGKKRKMIVKDGIRKCVEEDALPSFLQDGWVIGVTPLKYKRGTSHTAKSIKYEGKVYNSIKECMFETGKSRFIIIQTAIEL